MAAKAGKKWYQSLTLWTNGLAVVGIVVQGITGKAVMPPEAQAGILAILNVILRLKTDKGIG